jgi:hypothetical protein
MIPVQNTEPIAKSASKKDINRHLPTVLAARVLPDRMPASRYFSVVTERETVEPFFAA